MHKKQKNLISAISTSVPQRRSLKRFDGFPFSRFCMENHELCEFFMKIYLRATFNTLITKWISRATLKFFYDEKREIVTNECTILLARLK